MTTTLSVMALKIAATLRKRVGPTAGVCGVGISTLDKLTETNDQERHVALVQLEEAGFIKITYGPRESSSELPRERCDVVGVVVMEPLQQFFDALDIHGKPPD